MIVNDFDEITRRIPFLLVLPLHVAQQCTMNKQLATFDTHVRLHLRLYSDSLSISDN